jgi:primosomal protein N' (replication factor Y)
MAPAHTTPAPDAEPADAGAERERVSVLLPLPLEEAYDYAVPAGMALRPGDYVQVPLGQRDMVGVVWGPGSGAVADEKLRPVARAFDLPPLPDDHRRFVDWVAGYTLSPAGAVLRMTLSVPAALDPPAPSIVYRAAEPVPETVRLTAARRQVLDLLEGGLARPGAELARVAGVSSGVIRGMADAGLLVAEERAADLRVPLPDAGRAGPTLSPGQAAAADALRAMVDGGGYGAALIDGVTGSGKTEVYFESIATALGQGRQVLVLLPEIALSAQWLDRFAKRFGVQPVAWHSDLTSAQRRTAWRQVALGHARVVVGARSALFLPYGELGLIVVDEEHEPAFKQEDGVIYHARDMAVARAHLAGHAVVLVSATPSIESLVNAEAGRYRRLHLPDRHGAASLPEIAAVDLREHRPSAGRFLSAPLLDGLVETLGRGEQAMLFLNRRGYAPLTLCQACGHRLECPNCAAWLVEHRLAGRLACHHCGLQIRRPQACPVCGAADSFVACGPGVERIAEEVDAVLPGARWTIAASDTIGGPRAMAELVGQVDRGEINLLIGTQMLAKGHHFPGLTLVGVVDADLGFANTGDFRAFERTYQMLHQVAGRAGRADRPGRVLLQTHAPDHPVLQALIAGDRDGFLAQEIETRRRAALPPFGRLAGLIISARERGQADQEARALVAAAPARDDVQIIGPAEAPLSLLRGRYRRRILVKASRALPLQQVLREWLSAVDIPGAVRVSVDIDPYSFL